MICRYPSEQRTPAFWTRIRLMKTPRRPLVISSIQMNDDENDDPGETTALRTEEDFRKQAAEAYALYAWQYKKRFRWLTSGFFIAALGQDLMTDATTLRNILVRFGEWEVSQDAKLHALEDLLMREHPDRKVLVFTQFADTVRYLEQQLTARGVTRMAAVTGDSTDPTKTGLALQPEEQRKRGPHLARGGIASAGRYGCIERRAKPSGLRHCRELRPAVGHYPPDSKSRPRGPHRTAGAGDPVLFLPSG